jgi:hypothetical protein
MVDLTDSPWLGGILTIPVKQLPVKGDHPLLLAQDKAIWQHPTLGGVVNGLLVFRGVYLSKREMTEYLGGPMNPDGFKEPYIVEDINRSLRGEVLNVYPIEGRLDEPNALVYWEVIARSFELQVE